MIEPSFELPLPGGGSGDVHCRLPAAEDHEGFLGSERGGVEGGVGRVGFEECEVAAADQFGGFVFRGGDEVGAVGRSLDVGHLHAVFVRGEGFEEFAGLIVQRLGQSLLAVVFSEEEDDGAATHLRIILRH